MVPKDVHILTPKTLKGKEDVAYVTKPKILKQRHYCDYYEYDANVIIRALEEGNK